MPTAKKHARDPYRMRKCKHCKLPFKPTTKNPANADEQQFCSPAHRKDFWKYGALPVEKLFGKFEKRAREIAREEFDLKMKSPASLNAMVDRVRELMNDPEFEKLMRRLMPQPPPIAFPTLMMPQEMLGYDAVGNRIDRHGNIVKRKGESW